jgi:hypothetical protein
MASRSGNSVGMIVSLVVLFVFALGLFATTVIFFAKSQERTKQLASAQSALSQAIPSTGDDRWQELRSAAGNQPVVPWLDDQFRTLSRLVSGRGNATLEQMQTRAEDLTGGDSGSLFAALEAKDAEISRLSRSEQQASAAADAARADLQAKNLELETIREDYARSTAALTAQIDSYQQELALFRGNVGEQGDEFQTRAAEMRDRFDSEVSTLQRELNERRNEIERLETIVRGFDRSGTRLLAEDEASLIDGMVVGLNTAANEVFISRGRNDNMVLGMTFEVYTSGTSVRPDADGEYSAGKATIEVIRIDDNSSVARVLRTSRGNPILEGDLIVNPVYDPNKVYSFVVYGNFDTNNDFIFTPQERSELVSLVEEWGGRVDDDISGETDFVVLGQRPNLPPAPKIDDPIEIVQRYRRLAQEQRKYDELFETASATGIPVLNQNRFLTLTGLRAR